MNLSTTHYPTHPTHAIIIHADHFQPFQSRVGLDEVMRRMRRDVEAAMTQEFSLSLSLCLDLCLTLEQQCAEEGRP